MSKLVYALSYREFIDTMHNNKVTEENIEERLGAIIEIMGEQDFMFFPFYFKHEHHNVLRLTFDDVDERLDVKLFGEPQDNGREYIPVVPMSEDQAKLIIKFVEANENAKAFFVHCAAGISRSAAVAKWIDQKFNTDDTIFNVNNPIIKPNQRILSILRKLSNYE